MITVYTLHKGIWHPTYRFADNDAALGVCVTELANAGIAFKVGA